MPPTLFTKSDKAPYTAQERALRELRRRIMGGSYPSGTLLPTERQLSESVGISRPMIRAALSRLAEDGWIHRPPKHRPRVAASLPVNPDTDFDEVRITTLSAPLAVLLPMDPHYPAAYGIQRGIQRSLQHHESARPLLLFDTLVGTLPRTAAELSATAERKILDTFAVEGIAGVILWPIGGAESLPAVRRLREHGVSVVFVDRYPDTPDAPPCDFVGVDNRTGARTMVRYLIEQGHRRIAHLTFWGRCTEGTSVSVRERYEGYQEALWEQGLPTEPGWVGDSATLLAQIRAGGASAPTAVFAVNDASAHHFIERAAAEGIRVPEAISVVGFDDLDRYSPRTPILTTMHAPFEAIGERAVELLLRRLRTPLGQNALVQHLLLETSLVVRSTCAERHNALPVQEAAT